MYDIKGRLRIKWETRDHAKMFSYLRLYTAVLWWEPILLWTGNKLWMIVIVTLKIKKACWKCRLFILIS
ncbi:hypothetical protein HYN56_15970 [Flavobacterium crocinum]|uniref:Uncharacterized protein n=1 Tax=Flavobacterium crocinum TaxID=2183896 RepID=A0A2S1YNI3_9FLAO|nr:hypothetical protein HYN56_15970 [Flavobacterium crocinum]